MKALKRSFVAIVLDMWSFYAIFHLTDFSSEPFDFLSSKVGSTVNARRALSSHRALPLTSV